jgi:hypothetical protein
MLFIPSVRLGFGGNNLPHEGNIRGAKMRGLLFPVIPIPVRKRKPARAIMGSGNAQRSVSSLEVGSGALVIPSFPALRFLERSWFQRGFQLRLSAPSGGFFSRTLAQHARNFRLPHSAKYGTLRSTALEMPLRSARVLTIWIASKGKAESEKKKNLGCLSTRHSIPPIHPTPIISCNPKTKLQGREYIEHRTVQRSRTIWPRQDKRLPTSNMPCVCAGGRAGA